MISKIIVVLVSVLSTVWSHGRLTEPPGRSTMWRPQYGGHPTPPNYDDDALWCGGREILRVNNEKCGICGDQWDTPEPRDNEDGGKYGNKIIVRTYTRGQVIQANVDLTKHHNGYFEFRLCPMTHEEQIADQACFDRYPLTIIGSGTRFTLPDGSAEGNYPFQLKLPEDLTCSRCVLQWHYKTANHWGDCKNGTNGNGVCSDEEFFRGCADVKILSENDIANEGSIYKNSPFLKQAKNIAKPLYQKSDKHNSNDNIPAKSEPKYPSPGNSPCQQHV